MTTTLTIVALFACLTNAQEGTLSDGGATKCTPKFEPVRNIGCNYSDTLYCAEAAKAVFFQCSKKTPTGISDPDDATYCQNIDVECGPTCKAIRSIPGTMRELSTMNILDFILEVIQFFVAFYFTWKLFYVSKGDSFGTEEAPLCCIEDADADTFKSGRLLAIVIITLIDNGLQGYIFYLTSSVKDSIGTFFKAECVDLMDPHLLQHHDILKSISGSATAMVALGGFELFTADIAAILDGVDLNMDKPSALPFVALFMQLAAVILAGIDLFVYTLDAQHQAEQALGYFDGGFVADVLQTSTEVLTIAATERGSNALVSGLVQHQTLLNAGIGNWCVMSTNETVSCLSSL